MQMTNSKQPIDAYTSACSGEGATARKVALADVLWTGANEHLWTGGDEGCGPIRYSESCWAVIDALPDYSDDTPVYEFLTDLGCDCGWVQFRDFHAGPIRQGVRYMWLLLAMHVAEDEGIQIEVPA
jgi:hypothetical protein